MTNTELADVRLAALAASVGRLRALAGGLDDGALGRRAYPAEWTIADVLSHLGSGAVIHRRRVEDAVAGRPMPADFAPSVWDEWNAKSPRQKSDDCLVADTALVERLGSFTADERARVEIPMGPLTLDFAGIVGMRVNEHVLHTWDVEVALDPSAVLPSAAAALVVDNLELIARFSGKPTGTERTFVVATTDPDRRFSVVVTADGVVLAPGADGEPDVELPAEAFARLVYGRLDPGPRPAASYGAALDELRGVFKGV